VGLPTRWALATGSRHYPHIVALLVALFKPRDILTQHTLHVYTSPTARQGCTAISAN